MSCEKCFGNCIWKYTEIPYGDEDYIAYENCMEQPNNGYCFNWENSEPSYEF